MGKAEKAKRVTKKASLPAIILATVLGAGYWSWSEVQEIVRIYSDLDMRIRRIEQTLIKPFELGETRAMDTQANAVRKLLDRMAEKERLHEKEE